MERANDPHEPKPHTPASAPYRDESLAPITFELRQFAAFEDSHGHLVAIGADGAILRSDGRLSDAAGTTGTTGRPLNFAEIGRLPVGTNVTQREDDRPRRDD